MLDGLAVAKQAGLDPVKVNAVMMRGVNDDEAADLPLYCVDRGYELRFIEQMPLDAGHGWDRDDMITRAEIRQSLGERFSLTEQSRTGEVRGSEPAQRFVVDGGPASVGVIAAVTAPLLCGVRPAAANLRRSTPVLLVRRSRD